MDVLVTGGTGFVGSNLCAELADRGHDVTALARTPDSGTVPDGVETVMGDVTAYDSIEAAFEGRDAVVNLVALSPLFKARGGGDPHDRVHRGGTEHCLRAAREHDVPRFVQLSGIHASPEANTAYLRAKGAAEQLVRDSDRDWVIYRPTIVFGEGCEFVDFVKLVTTPYVTGLPGGGRVRYQPIAIEDFAPILADGVTGDDHVGEVYEIGGPEQLTLAEITRLVYRAEGTSVRILPVPTPVAKAGLTVGGYLPFVPLGRDQARSMDTDLVVAHNDVDAFGVDPDGLRTFADYLGLNGRSSA